jgi:hypothetical protein
MSEEHVEIVRHVYESGQARSFRVGQDLGKALEVAGFPD